MNQHDHTLYIEIKKLIQEGNLDSINLNRADLNKENCDDLLSLVQDMQIENNKQWEVKKKFFKLRQYEKHPVITDIKVYQALLNQLDMEKDSALKNYYDKKNNLLTLEVSLQSKKRRIIQIELFEAYQEVLKNYLYTQVTRLNHEAPQCYKKAILENYIFDCEKMVNVLQFPELKELLPKIRDVTREHREKNYSWRYYLKFNWLRNPTSYNEFNKVFDQNNELKEKKKWF